MSSIPYDLQKIRAIAFDVDGVLSPSAIPLSPEGEPLRMVNIKDGYAIQYAVKQGLLLCIITGAKTPGLRVRYQALGMKDVHLAAAVKMPVLLDWMARYDLKPDEVAYVGDDIPDLQVLRAVGLPCCPCDACHEVKDACSYISPASGGHGVARDVIEQTLAAQGKWLDSDHAFGW